VLETKIVDGELSAHFGRDESHAVARAWRDGLLALWCRTVGAEPGTAVQTTFEPATDYESAWREVWTVPGGAMLTFTGEGVMSGHGCHGETLVAKATGLPSGVELQARWHVDHRRGGSVHLTLHGTEGLVALEAQLRAAK